MKYIFSIILFFIIGGVFLKAQEGNLQERLNSLKIAYITEKLVLTSEEAQRFWPIYNEYMDALGNLKEENEKRKEEMKQEMLASNDAELEKLVDGFITSQKQEYEVNLAYHDKFKEVLPIRKIILLYKAQDEFKQRVFSELARRRMQGRRNGENN